MDPDRDASTPADRVALALELTEVGLRMSVQRFRREHPEATEPDVEAFERAWWRRRPGTETSDASGTFRSRTSR